MVPSKKYSIGDVVSIARRRYPLVLVPLVLGLFVALLVSSRLPNIYQAETLIQIVPQRVPDSFVQSTVTIRIEDRIDALRQQVESRTQLERMIQELNLYPEARALRPMQDLVEGMKSNTELQVVRAGRGAPIDAFYLRFKYTDPFLAARVTERLAKLYVQFNAKERGSLADGANQFLEAQLAVATAKLEEQERRLQGFRERNAGRLPTQLDFNMQAIQNTQMQRQALVESLARDRDLKLMRERLYNDALASPPVVVRPMAPAVPGDPVTPVMSPLQQLEVARGALTRLEQRVKEGHPDLRRARKQVADLERLAAGAPGATDATASTATTPEEAAYRERLSGQRAEIESLNRQIAFKESEEVRLTGVIAEHQRRIEAVPGLESEWLSLTRENETTQAQYKDLLTKSEAAKVSANLENQQIGEQFRTLDAPRVPNHAISPQRMLITAGGAAAGLMLGLLLVVGLELSDGSFKNEADVSLLLGLPVLAVVPNLVTVQDKQRLKMRRLLYSATVMMIAGAAGYVFWSLQLWNFVT